MDADSGIRKPVKKWIRTVSGEISERSKRVIRMSIKEYAANKYKPVLNSHW
jgi:hypothetical protein